MKKCGFLGGKEAIKSLRSSGYRDTAMAIGELIDNSIQAKATDISVILVCNQHTESYSTVRVNTIAVIDNGCGMDTDLLQNSLRLGEGNNRNEEAGMGKFGVGLPQASISQTQRVDVWSKTVSSSYNHVFIDLSDETWLNNAEIEDPDDESIPSIYQKYISDESGTIVVWSDVDHVSWKKPDTIFQKCENQIGRMYRNWLSTGDVRISMIPISLNGKVLGDQKYFRAVDPLFLMEDAKCGSPPETPMFKMYRAPDVKKYQIQTDTGMKDLCVTLRYSIAKDSVRLAEDIDVPGSTDFGKIAKDCIGVSIVREGRELELSTQWHYVSKDPRHRWWGAEISFNRDLDDIFGVTNNKQSATKLNELATVDYKNMMDDFDITEEDRDRGEKLLAKESMADYILMDVVTSVQKVINEMNKEISTNTRRSKKEKISRHGEVSEAQKKYDDLAETRSKDISNQSETDILMVERGENRSEFVEKELENADGYSDEDKEKVVHDVKSGHRCSILPSAQDSSSFFNIERKDTQMIIRLNCSHPMYDQLFGKFVDILSSDVTNTDDILISVNDAFETVQFLLAAWARMEDEDRDPRMKREYRRIREKWGEILEDSYKNEDD